jgi:hypothetical protein
VVEALMSRQSLQIIPSYDYPIVTRLEGAQFAADSEIAPPEVPLPPDVRPDAARMFLIWGSAGVLIGAAVTMGVTALSFGSFKKSKSVVGPMLWAGGGSLLTGFLLLLAMRRALTHPGTDSARWLALATGTNAAT